MTPLKSGILRNTGRSYTLVTIIILSAALASCHKSKESEEKTPEIEVSTPLVESVVLSREYPASITSESHADVVARVNGQITGMYFTEGAHVVKGQKLFTIETVKYTAAVNEARATLSNAQSQFSYASDRLDALGKALQSDAVSQMDVVQARNNKIQAEAAVRSARAALRIAETNLGYCTVVAPVSGKISSTLYDVGAYVGGEGAPVTLATIYDEDTLALEFDIEESQYASLAEGNIQIGDSLMSNLPFVIGNDGDDDGSGDRFTADIYYVSPAVNSSTGTLRLKGHVKDTKGILRQGMYARAALPYGRCDKAILVNDASIGTDQLGKYLYVVNDSDKVTYRHIEVGALYNDTLRLVTKGISPNEKYVTEALLNVRQGMKVIPVDAKGAKFDKR